MAQRNPYLWLITKPLSEATEESMLDIQHRVEEKENELHCERSKSKSKLCNLLGALLA